MTPLEQTIKDIVDFICVDFSVDGKKQLQYACLALVERAKEEERQKNVKQPESEKCDKCGK